MGRKVNIFVIYTPADKEVVLHLLGHLDPLKNIYDLTVWQENPIIPGQPWEIHFESRANHTDVFLLLVSKDLLNSQFVDQPEFKAVIDLQKAQKAEVIPIIVENCEWDTVHKLIDYEFNLNALQVLPENGKPISEWTPPDQAYRLISEEIGVIIESFLENLKEEEVKKDPEKKAVKTGGDGQVAIPFATEGVPDKAAKETTNSEGEIDPEEEHRRWEEAEARRRAEVAKRIKEEAEASARRRAEEERLWEEALERRRVDKARRIREEAAMPKQVSGGEARAKEEEASRRKAAKQKRMKEEAVALAKKKAEQERRAREAKEARRKALDEKRFEQEELETATLGRSQKEQIIKDETQASSELEAIPQGKKVTDKKRMLLVSLGAIFTFVLIWFFSAIKTGTEETPPASSNRNPPTAGDSIVTEQTSADSPAEEANFARLAVGDLYEGGIIFETDPSGHSGKIAHLDDAGPMTWQDAAKIHEQLGEGWRLPTFDELMTMYHSIGQGATNRGEFADGLYWSATDYDDYQARLLRFRDGNTSYHYNKNLAHRQFKVRAVRDFSR